MSEEEPCVYCSFCNKSQDEVWKMIAGVNVYICDDCIKLSYDIVFGEYREEGAKLKKENT